MRSNKYMHALNAAKNVIDHYFAIWISFSGNGKVESQVLKTLQLVWIILFAFLWHCPRENI